MNATKWEKDGSLTTVFSTSSKENLRSAAPTPSTSSTSAAALRNPNDLMMSSPSKRKQLKKTARQLKEHKEQFCRKCEMRYKASDDRNNPWVGCKGLSHKKEKCTMHGVVSERPPRSCSNAKLVL